MNSPWSLIWILWDQYVSDSELCTFSKLIWFPITKHLNILTDTILHIHTKLDKQRYVSLDKVVPPNQLGRDVLFSVSLGFQKFKTGTKDLYHNSWDILNITLCVPGTIPGASHTFTHLIPPTLWGWKVVSNSWGEARAGRSAVDLASWVGLEKLPLQGGFWCGPRPRSGLLTPILPFPEAFLYH